jgi:glycosyltransferase involved in cell wall biosynthesis
MKVIHISTSDNKGGGARSAYRLHRQLLREGIDSSMYVKNKFTLDAKVIRFSQENSFFLKAGFKIRRRLDAGNLAYVRRMDNEHVGFAVPASPAGFKPFGQLPSADIITLNWVAGFWDYRLLLKLVGKCKGVVWRLSDMNPFTGGCFYDAYCGRFQESCGCCPCLNSNSKFDVSRKYLRLKKSIVEKLPNNFLHVVAQSKWIEGQIKASAVFRKVPVTRIPNGIDVEKFQPMDKYRARKIMGVPHCEKLILCVAESFDKPIKGSVFLFDALRIASSQLTGSVSVLAIGKGRLHELNDMEVRQEEITSDEMLVAAYSAGDVFVITSLQDNLPNTVLEAMACGVPVVGFDIGGVPDMVIHGETGYLAPVKDSVQLAEHIISLLNNPSGRQAMADASRSRIVDNFSIERQAKKYLELYQRLLS